MVTDPGTKKRADRLRPLNVPRPIEAEADERGRPCRVRGVEVTAVTDRWRIDDEWWREPVSRLYWQVELADGRALTLFRDLVKDGWWEQRYP